MAKDDLARFLRRIFEDEELRREVVALAAEKGYDLTAQELGDADLDEIAGGPNRREHDHIGLTPKPLDPLTEP